MTFLYDYTGVIHIHSSYSFDAHIPVPTLIKEAIKNRLDFVMLTDHAHMRAREEGFEGWHNNTLLIVGQEISPRFNHYLAFGLRTPVSIPEDQTEIPPQTYIDQVNQQGGFGFIAHPDHRGVVMFHVKHYPWIDWTVTGYTGMGIWDFMSDWQSSVRGFFTALRNICLPAFVLKGPMAETLKRWDRLNQSRKVVGIGELDNHGHVRRFCGVSFTLFPFSKAFKFLRTHIVTDKPLVRKLNEDINTIFSSLQRGRVYVSAEYYREAKGFLFSVVKDNQQATMGDSFVLDEHAYLVLLLPTEAKIRIIKDGTIFREEITHNVTMRITQTGVYRAEVYIKVWGKYLPWIFSNPIYVIST